MQDPMKGKMPFVEFCKMSEIKQVKQLLIDEGKLAIEVRKDDVIATPYFLQDGRLISLQFNGWDIQLLEDGTWTWTDTTGG